MYLEFIDLLRCPNPHESASLVAALDKMDGRHVVTGTLGCPMCGAGYSIRNGEAVFDVDAGVFFDGPAANPPVDATMIAAFLDLTRPGALALLAGHWASAANDVAALTQTRVIALNSPGSPASSDAVAAVRAGIRIPLANNSLDGIALDLAHSTPAMVDEAVRLLHSRGRLVAASGVSLPPQFNELARDVNNVVAEFTGDLIPLRR